MKNKRKRVLTSTMMSVMALSQLSVVAYAAIDSIIITIADPVAGNNLATTATVPEGEPYTVTNVVRTAGTTTGDVVGTITTAEFGNTYTATIT